MVFDNTCEKKFHRELAGSLSVPSDRGHDKPVIANISYGCLLALVAQVPQVLTCCGISADMSGQ